jgi:hypothetical protein
MHHLSISGLCIGDAQFESQPELRISWIFFVFASHSRKIPREVLKLDQDRFLSQRPKFIIY